MHIAMASLNTFFMCGCELKTKTPSKKPFDHEIMMVKNNEYHKPLSPGDLQAASISANAQSTQQAECVFPVSLASTANLKERISSADLESPLPDQLIYTVFSLGALAHAETSDLHC